MAKKLSPDGDLSAVSLDEVECLVYQNRLLYPRSLRASTFIRSDLMLA